MAALEPFAQPPPKQDPEVLPYLKDPKGKAYDVKLKVEMKGACDVAVECRSYWLIYMSCFFPTQPKRKKAFRPSLRLISSISIGLRINSSPITRSRAALCALETCSGLGPCPHRYVTTESLSCLPL